MLNKEETKAIKMFCICDNWQFKQINIYVICFSRILEMPDLLALFVGEARGVKILPLNVFIYLFC